MSVDKEDKDEEEEVGHEVRSSRLRNLVTILSTHVLVEVEVANLFLRNEVIGGNETNQTRPDPSRG